MELILDTCALLSLAGIARKRLTKRTIQLISAEDHVNVSACSLFEISLKLKRSQLDLGRFRSAKAFWEEATAAYELEDLPILSEDFHSAVSLPDYHSDPFDRIIIAQAMRTRSEIVTYDRCFSQYMVRLHE